jgi:hypothetical protein
MMIRLGLGVSISTAKGQRLRGLVIHIRVLMRGVASVMRMPQRPKVHLGTSWRARCRIAAPRLHERGRIKASWSDDRKTGGSVSGYTKHVNQMAPMP